MGAEVLAEAGVEVFLGIEGLEGIAGLVEGGAGEFVLEFESADDGFAFGGGSTAFAESFEDNAVGVELEGGVIDDFDEDLVAGSSVFGAGVIDGDVFGDFAAVGGDEPVFFFAVEGADELGDASLEDMDDFAGVRHFAVAFCGFAGEGDDAVAGEGVEGFSAGDKEVALSGVVFGSDEAIAAGGGLEGSGEAL